MVKKTLSDLSTFDWIYLKQIPSHKTTPGKGVVNVDYTNSGKINQQYLKK